MKFSSVLALAAAANALPKNNDPKDSSLKVVARDDKPENEIKKNTEDTYQQRLLAVLDQIKNGQVPDEDSESEEPKHCGCSKSYDNPNPSDCDCEKPCPCQPMEERLENQPKYRQVELDEREDESGSESEGELDDEDDEAEAEDEDGVETTAVECKPKPECEPKDECKPKVCDLKPEAQPLVPACENYVKQGDCIFCDLNSNVSQDPNESCIPKVHPKPCKDDSDSDSDSDSEDECGCSDKKDKKKKKKGPFNPFRKAPFDHTFATKN